MARLFDRLSDQTLANRNGLKNWGQRVVEKLEEVLAAQQETIDDLAAIVADIAAAQDAADAAATAAASAQSTANTANSTATTVKRDDKISASWTSPGAVLSASDAGTDATITIAAHVRKYGDATSLSVAGGTLTGRSYSTTYYIYYNDTTTADTTPTYLSTTDPNIAQPNAGAGRHFLGIITTPGAGAPPSSGGYTPPGGYGDENDIP